MIKYISVIAKMSSTGKVSPLSIIWEDGREFSIDKIIDCRPKASTKGGGKGLRYTVKIKGQEKYLFLNEYLWFIEL
ncbi:MAG: hypothetical protein IKC11_06150 [Clostridia bacterium]|nr:hypothetical protein [Clostridia bacterium]